MGPPVRQALVARVTLWPVGTMHVNATPAVRPSSQFRASLGVLGEDDRAQGPVSLHLLCQSPGQMPQCCSVRVIGKQEHMHLRASPWEGVLSTWAGGEAEGGSVSGPCGPHILSAAAVPSAVPGGRPLAHRGALEQSWCGRRGGGGEKSRTSGWSSGPQPGGTGLLLLRPRHEPRILFPA